MKTRPLSLLTVAATLLACHSSAQAASVSGSTSNSPL